MSTRRVNRDAARVLGSAAAALLLAVSVLVAVPGGAWAAGLFAPKAGYATGADPNRIAVADLNGDGRPDLITTDVGADAVSVLLGNGDGTFRPRLSFATESYPGSITVADLNGDGRPDLAVGSYIPSKLSLLFGNGDGTFQPHQALNTWESANFVHAADFNRDGKADLVMGLDRLSSVDVWLGNGDGTFQPGVRYPTDNGATEAAVVDLDRDGLLDLAVTNLCDETVSVLPGNGDGTFRPKRSFPAGLAPTAVVATDLNGDGRPDLAVTNGLFPDLHPYLTVWLGNGDLTFSPGSTFPLPSRGPNGLTVADFDADGKPDLAVSASDINGVSAVSVLLGNGDGTLRPADDYDGGTDARDVAAADLDGDGLPDLAVPSEAESTAEVLLNQAKAPVRSTLDSSPNPSAYGAPVTFTDTVCPLAGALTTPPTGTVAFTEGSSTLGSAPLGPVTGTACARAQLTLTGLAPGRHTVAAAYPGDGRYLPGRSADLTQTVDCTTTVRGPADTVNAGPGTCVLGATVGTVAVRPGGSLYLADSTVTGALTAERASRVTVCSSTVDGIAAIGRTGGPVVIGDPDHGCGPDHVRGSLVLRANTGGTQVSAARIDGSLICTRNTPPPTDAGLPDTVGGRRLGQCATL
ncbi:hypothetical protein ATKI12_3631 [Kitasatospora sp. Ki12]